MFARSAENPSDHMKPLKVLLTMLVACAFLSGILFVSNFAFKLPFWIGFPMHAFLMGIWIYGIWALFCRWDIRDTITCPRCGEKIK